MIHYYIDILSTIFKEGKHKLLFSQSANYVYMIHVMQKPNSVFTLTLFSNWIDSADPIRITPDLCSFLSVVCVFLCCIHVLLARCVCICFMHLSPFHIHAIIKRISFNTGKISHLFLYKTN